MGKDIGTTYILLLKGRIAETVTQRDVAVTDVQFQYLVDGTEVSLPTQINVKPSGYYGVLLSSLTGLPEPSPDADVVLRIIVTTQDGREIAADQTLSGADLQAGTWPLPDVDANAALPTLVNAPFTLNIGVDPAPVMLHGQVLQDNDPNQPADGAIVELAALSTTSDARGSFRIGPVPLAQTSALTIRFDGTDTDFTLRPDFSASVNFRTFAI